eukprot:9490387-Pyramimonas_sp.AAC.1
MAAFGDSGCRTRRLQAWEVSAATQHGSSDILCACCNSDGSFTCWIHMACPLEGWDASDTRAPRRAEMESATRAPAWQAQAPPLFRQVP